MRTSYLREDANYFRYSKGAVFRDNASFAKVPLYSGSLAEYNDATEGNYNERIVKENSGRYFLMDRNLTYRGGAMEFCDIFSKDKELIHIKRYGGSATLSHLFYQGVASAEFFQMEDEYRKLIRNKLPKPFQVFDPAKRPQFEEYHVIFGIISRSDKPLTMPFFSRVGIRHAMRRLQGFGYKVSLAKIGVAETRSKLQKMRPKLPLSE